MSFTATNWYHLLSLYLLKKNSHKNENLLIRPFFLSPFSGFTTFCPEFLKWSLSPLSLIPQSPQKILAPPLFNVTYRVISSPWTSTTEPPAKMNWKFFKRFTSNCDCTASDCGLFIQRTCQRAHTTQNSFSSCAMRIQISFDCIEISNTLDFSHH